MEAQKPTSDTWDIHHEDFRGIIGSNPTIELLLQIEEYPFAHEAGVFLDNTNELIITSNQIQDASGQRVVKISKVSLENKPVKLEEIQCSSIHMANGGVNYQGGVLLCAQGSSTHPSGVFKMDIKPPYHTEPVVTSYLGKPYNAVNDVVVHPDGSIWFTDPCYGHDQGYRPRPSLPNQVYRYQPITGSIRAMADGFGRPNGISFSPDFETVYVTDTDQVRGQCIDISRSASIYAFDLIYRSGQPFLANRRLFALADNGIPDGIKCDTRGNVYSGCGDGVHIWSAGGILLGKILIPGGVANFCFGRKGDIFILNENRLWLVRLDSDIKGALLDI